MKAIWGVISVAELLGETDLSAQQREWVGTIVGSGTVSNRDPSKGSCCIAERRMLEILDSGEAKTPFLAFGDRVRIEMRDAKGRLLFGAIDQRVVARPDSGSAER